MTGARIRAAAGALSFLAGEQLGWQLGD